MNQQQARLSRLCGMLGSAAATERALAAEKATALLRELGLTWGELVAKAFAPPPAREVVPVERPAGRAFRRAAPVRTPVRNGWAAVDVIEWLDSHRPPSSTDWEIDFIVDIAKEARRPDFAGLTERQWPVVLSLVAKARQAA